MTLEINDLELEKNLLVKLSLGMLGPFSVTYFKISIQNNLSIHQSGVSSTIFKKSTLDLVYPGQNSDVREIFRNLIGSLEVWKLEKTDLSQKNKTPDWCIVFYLFFTVYTLSLIHI